jgi:gas vesicle protein
MMNEKSNFLAGILIGALAGIGLGMLIAPQAGEATRQKIRDRADEMGSRLRSGTDDLSGRVRKGADELGQRGRTMVDDLTQRGRSAVDEGSRKLREAYDRGRETIGRVEQAGDTGDNESA